MLRLDAIFVFVAGVTSDRVKMQDVLQTAWTFVNDRFVFFRNAPMPLLFNVVLWKILTFIR